MKEYEVTIHRTEEYVAVLEAEGIADLQRQISELIVTDGRTDDVWVSGEPVRSYISKMEHVEL